MHRGKIRQFINQLSILYKAVDAAVIILALYTALHLRGYYFDQYYINLGLLSITVFMLVAECQDLYRSWRSSPFIAQAGLTVAVWLTTVLVLLVVAYVYKVSEAYSRIVVLTWCLLTMLALTGWRFCFRRVLKIVRRNYFNTRSAAVIGVNSPALQLAREFSTNPAHGIRFLGFFDDRNPARLEQTVAVAGKIADLLTLARSGEVDNVYISLPLSAEERTLDILDKLADTTATVSILPNFLVYSLLHARWNPIGDILTLSVHDTPIQGSDEYLKRIEDIVLFFLVFPVIALPLLIIAIAVKCSSPGPIIFRQRRYGLDGKKFEVLKFRTMTTLEDGDFIRQATADDARVTPLGRILRKYSLDELPQIFNVLAGNMSFVGPRPHAVAHNEAYRKLIRGYMLRHKVKPGITGWAQVNGLRGETETVEKMKKRVEFDLEYIQNWSIATDLKILSLTLLNSRKIIANAC